MPTGAVVSHRAGEGAGSSQLIRPAAVSSEMQQQPCRKIRWQPPAASGCSALYPPAMVRRNDQWPPQREAPGRP